MNTDILLRLYNIVSKSALHFGIETWILRREDKRHLEASHIRFIRPLIGVSRRDRLSNEEIRNRLKTTNVANHIQSYQLNWKQHVDRTGEKRFTKQLLNYKPIGTRDFGRPRSRWTDQF
jgi:hypothetical protein